MSSVNSESFLLCLSIFGRASRMMLSETGGREIPPFSQSQSESYRVSYAYD